MVIRRAWSVLGNSQRLDGGAMFGNAPRALWSRWITPDELNRIPLACRCLLIREETPDGMRHILFEAGIGAFFDPKMRSRFGVQEPHHVLLDQLATLGVTPDLIDVVVLSHLHFDHAGGLLSAWAPDQEPTLVFPQAYYVVGEEAVKRAEAPHARDRASFIPELLPLLKASQRLEIVASGASSSILGEGYDFHLSHGHTPGQLLTEIKGTEHGSLVFCGDLIPGTSWVHLPITMGYDRFPELLIEEKDSLLSELITRQARLFFTHDSEYACAEIQRDEQGRFSALRPSIQLTGEIL